MTMLGSFSVAATWFEASFKPKPSRCDDSAESADPGQSTCGSSRDLESTWILNLWMELLLAYIYVVVVAKLTLPAHCDVASISNSINSLLKLFRAFLPYYALMVLLMLTSLL
jgi:hypothetical protein